MLFCSASTSEWGRGRIQARITATLVCPVRSRTPKYAPSRFSQLLPFFAPVCALARLPAVPVSPTLRPRPSRETNNFSFTCCHSSHLSAPSPQSGKQTTFPYKSLRPRGEGVGKCRRMRGQKQATNCNVRLWSGGTLSGDSSTDARNDML